VPRPSTGLRCKLFGKLRELKRRGRAFDRPDDHHRMRDASYPALPEAAVGSIRSQLTRIESPVLSDGLMAIEDLVLFLGHRSHVARCGHSTRSGSRSTRFPLLAYYVEIHMQSLSGTSKDGSVGGQFDCPQLGNHAGS